MNFFIKLFSKKPTRPYIPFVNNPSGNIIAARVEKIEKHPNADRLQVVSLFDGTQIVEPVVCGAHNFKTGDIVALALPGAQITQNIHSENNEPFILQKATIRGIESQGMICSQFELGLSEEKGDGIMILPSDTQPGTILS